MVDLAELKLPPLDEPNHPRLRQYTQRHTREWSEQVDAADAFVFVTPEYNHGYPASLKLALDYLHHEWRYKPVGFVSYGGVAAGTRSVEQLQQVVTALRMTAVIEQVNIPFYQQFIDDDDGEVHANRVMEQAAGTMLDQLRAAGLDAAAVARRGGPGGLIGRPAPGRPRGTISGRSSPGRA